MTAIATPVAAKFSAPNCGDVTEQQFRYVRLYGNTSNSDTSLVEPVHMALDKRSDDSVDIYFAERRGKVKLYDGATHKVTMLANLDPYILLGDTQSSGGKDAGLTGIALDPGFKRNGWIYLYYTPKAASVFRLSRFTLASGKLDAEKILLSFPMQREFCCHTGGAMAFDALGNLWVTTGNNSPDAPGLVDEVNWAHSAEASSGNPSDLRGGVLRIHPDDSPKGYSIPKGNFGEYWSQRFAATNPALAAQYADPTKVLPEIYVKGTRSNYSIAVDPYRERMVWGEFLPNGVDEHNYVNHPTFAGYPYWAGPGNRAYAKGGGTLAAPMNNSVWNKGPKQLPPAETALHPYYTPGGGGGVTGPIYRYDGDLASPIKFPPHFDKAWFVTDFFDKRVTIFSVNEEGNKLQDSVTWFGGFNFDRVLDMEQGPDGALYVLNYGGRYTYSATTSVGRIEYTGPCHSADPKLPTAYTGLRGKTEIASQNDPGLIRIDPLTQAIEIPIAGPYRLTVQDVEGRKVFAASAQGPRRFGSAEVLGNKRGLFFASVTAGTRSVQVRCFRF